jgi:hypothetical protein
MAGAGHLPPWHALAEASERKRYTFSRNKFQKSSDFLLDTSSKRRKHGQCEKESHREGPSPRQWYVRSGGIFKKTQLAH